MEWLRKKSRTGRVWIYYCRSGFHWTTIWNVFEAYPFMLFRIFVPWGRRFIPARKARLNLLIAEQPGALVVLFWSRA